MAPISGAGFCDVCQGPKISASWKWELVHGYYKSREEQPGQQYGLVEICARELDAIHHSVISAISHAVASELLHDRNRRFQERAWSRDLKHAGLNDKPARLEKFPAADVSISRAQQRALRYAIYTFMYS